MAPFVILGIAGGFTLTVVLTALFPSDPGIGFSALAGYFSIFGVAGGLAIGLGIYLILDRRSRKRSTDVTVTREKN
jgi:hypothetical protein